MISNTSFVFKTFFTNHAYKRTLFRVVQLVLDEFVVTFEKFAAN